MVLIRCFSGASGVAVGLVFFQRMREQRRRAARRRVAKELGAGFRAMLVGTAVGDAFGAGVEFQDAYWIRDERNVDFSRWVNRRGAYFTWNPLSSQNYTGGMYTDDAEMTIGLMKALIGSGVALSCDALVEYWRQEYELAKTHFLSAWIWGLVGVGRNGHGSMRWVYDGTKSIEDVRAFQRARKIPGNAGPMRALPLAFLPESERLQMAVTSADATHPHPKARFSTYLMATAAAYLICEGGDPQRLIAHCLTKGALLRESAPEAFDEETLEYLATMDAFRDYHDYGARLEGLPLETVCGPQPIAWASDMRGSPVRGLDSDTMHTVGVVLYLLKWNRGPLDGLQHSVWIGGDVDSIAALVLGVCGARRGLGFGEDGGLPFWMVEEVEAAEYILEVADSFESWIQGRHAAW